MRKIILYLFGLTLLFITCKHEPTQIPNIGLTMDTVGVPVPIRPLSNNICFTTQILPLFKANCSMQNGCHVSPGGADGILLTNFDEIKSRITKAMKEINKGEMPQNPYPGLNPSVLAILNQWINEGAQNTDCYHTPCDTLNVKYATHIAPLISNYCLGCHNGVNGQGNIRLHNYAEAKQHAQSGMILCTVKGKGCKFMPLGGVHIGLCNLNIIEKWIASGCPQ